MTDLITDPLFYCTAIPAVIILGLAKGGFSGVGTAATPLLALYLPPLEAAALLLPVLIVQDAISVWIYRHDWDSWNLKVLLPGAALGIAIAWFAADRVSDSTIRILIGLVGVAFVANVWLRPARTEPHQPTNSEGIFWGAVSGFTSFMTHAGGPPVQVFTLPQNLPKLTLVGTITIFFAAINAAKIVPYMALGQFTPRNLATSFALLPLAAAANFLGVWLVRRTPERLFYRISYALLLALSLALLWQGLRDWRGM